MIEPTAFWEAARHEMEEYKLAADLRLQPKWAISDRIAIQVGVSGRFSVGNDNPFPTTLDEYLKAAADVIEAGASGIALDYTWIEDREGRRLDRDMPPVEAYGAVLKPLRERFGDRFVANCNVLNGKDFDECMSPARTGLAEAAPCAAGHPDSFLLPAMRALEESGVKPEVCVHSSGEIELAKRKLIDSGIIKRPYYFLILYGLPFNTGRSLVSGTWVSGTRDMAQHLMLMVDQIRGIDPDAVIAVCAAGRATLYMTTFATLLGLHLRVGTEDTVWKYPNSDEVLESNLQMFQAAKQIAEMHGRRVATADEYREMLGVPIRSRVIER